LHWCIVFTMLRTRFIINLVFVTALLSDVGAQSTNVVYENDVNKQRLLLLATSQYIFTISQGQIDMDSSLLITCGIYNLSPFLIYTQNYSDEKSTQISTLLDAGKIKEAEARLTSGQVQSIRSLLEIGSYYVFKPGSVQTDLEKANDFIQQAIRESEKEKSKKWRIEALTLHAFHLQQAGNQNESLKVIEEVISLAEKSGNKKRIGQAYLDRAHLLPFGHPLRMINLEKALPPFQEARASEKEIETISDITTEYFITKQMNKVEQYLHKVLNLQQKIGYQHQQYVYDVLAYTTYLKSEHSVALHYSNKSLEHVSSRADSVLLPFFYTRKGIILMNVRKYDDSFTAYNMALEGKTKETRLFWYKAFLNKVLLYNTLRRSEEALALLEETGKAFPPASLFEEMHFNLMTGLAYDNQKSYDQAEVYYERFLAQAERFPPAFINVEFPQALLFISRYYADVKNIKKARELLELAKPMLFSNAIGKTQYYETASKIDRMDHKYKDAIDNLMLMLTFYDSTSNIEQRKKFEELTVQYETEKKDKDIQLLKQESELQQAKLDQSQFMRNITIAGAALLLFIAGLLYYLYVTKQKSNKQLTHLLDEKEWLLKEIHHRVKNNLQTVLSLLESQSRQLTNEAFDALQESQNRVFAMSLIHKKLYQSLDVSSINMEDYLRDLIQHLRDSFGSSGNILFSLEFDQIELDVSQAVPVGLIVNEAITNSIKYAFPKKQPGNEITISLKKVSTNKVVLFITDNGVGITNAKESTQSLGLKLMRGLTEDIEGTFSIESNHGVAIMIEFVANIPFERLSEPVYQHA